MRRVGYPPRRVRVVVLSCLSLLCAYAGTVAAGDKNTVDTEARTWLEKMSSAARSYSYDGIFIYLRGNEVQTVRIIHSVEGGRERERMVLLNGVPREVLRSNDKITYIIPKNRSMELERRRDHPQSGFPLISPDRIDKLAACYDISLNGQGRIAGRDAQRIVIRPKDRFRYGYRLWLDIETGLLLKTVLLNKPQNLSEQFMFTTLRFLDAVPPALLEPGVEGNEFVFFKSSPDEKGGVSASTLWHSSGLPRGFELSTHRRYSATDSRGYKEQLIYSDGLSSVSVFIEPLKTKQVPLRGASSLGVVNAFGTTYDSFQVIALGEVPPATVQQIATSIQRRPGTDDD